MATKKQLDQLQKLHEKNAKSQARRRAAEVSQGLTGTRADAEFAKEWLERDSRGNSAKVKAEEDRAVRSAGGSSRTERALRRLFGS